MKPDPLATAVSLVVLMLSAINVPTMLGLGPEAVTAIGGGIVAAAAIARLLVRRFRGSPLDWRDILGAVVGALASALGVDGLVTDSSAVDGIDPELITMIGSGLAAVASAHRAGHITKPPAGTGLVLLVCMASCSSEDATFVAVASAASLAIFYACERALH